MSLYTKRGDEGDTDLFSGERVSKVHPLIEAYGTVDELNSLLGLAESLLPEEDTDLAEGIIEVQNHLHIICANLADRQPEDRPEIQEHHVERLEAHIDELEEDLPPLRSFILPGGCPAGAQFHHARAVCRRAERTVIRAAEVEEVDGEIIRYLNRLSDLLFVLARSINHRQKQTERSPSYE